MLMPIPMLRNKSSWCWMLYSDMYDTFSKYFIYAISHLLWYSGQQNGVSIVLVLLNHMPTPFSQPEYSNKWIIVWMTYLLNLSYISLYGIGIGLSIGHPYGVAEWYADPIFSAWILWQMTHCVNDIFAEFIVHLTVQHSALERLVFGIGISPGHTQGVAEQYADPIL